MNETKWSEYKQTLLTTKERSIIEAKSVLISEIIRARQEKGITQQQLGEFSSVKQPMIARLEKGKTNPQFETLLKLLLPLGLTLTVEPLKKIA